MRRIGLVPILLAALNGNAEARTSIVVIDKSDRERVFRELVTTATSLASGDQLLIYSARPFARLAEITPNTDTSLNAARIKARLAQQFASVRAFLLAPAEPASATGDNARLVITDVMEELGRNVIPSLPDRRADIALIGTLNAVDGRDTAFAMANRFYPSEGLTAQARTQNPFGTAGVNKRLANSSVYFCYPGGEAEFATPQHEALVVRYWSLWVAAQSGRSAGFSKDLGVCFARFRSGDTTGQPVYQASTGSKPEMLRAAAPISALPATYVTPGDYFLRDDAIISSTPPARTKGPLWIGIKWSQPCDLDLYARGSTAAKWLYFGNARTDEGLYNKDFRNGTGEDQFEYIEFSADIDLTQVQVAINLYAGELPAPPEGRIRIWFDQKIFEGSFKLEARSGNHGAGPNIAPPYWISVDLRKIMGLPAS
jgi:hypothetical protein